MTRARWTVAAGLAPVLVAAGLAAWSLDFGLPYLFRPDEDVMVGRAVRMAATGSLDPLFANYPPLVFYVFAAAERLAGHVTGPTSGDPTGAYLVARSVSAGAFAASVGLTFLAGRHAYGTVAAAAAATGLAVAPLAVRQAHFATTDMVQTALVCAATLAALSARGRRGLVAAGALGGLAAAAKYTGIVALALVVTLAALRAGRPGIRAVVLAAAAGFAIPSAVMLLHPVEYAGGVLFLSANAYSRHGQLPPGILFHPTVTLPFGLGPGTYVLALAGTARALWRRSPADLGLLALCGAGLALTGPGREDFFRYMLPLLPALCLLAGALLDGLPAAVLGPALAGFGLLLLPALAVSAGTDRLLGREDTRVLAARWLESHAPPGSSVASPYYGGPFYGDREIIANQRFVADRLAASFLQGRYTARYDINGPDPQYVIRASGPPQQAPVPPPDGAPAASFRPGQKGAVYDPLDSFYVPIWGLERVERPGPALSIGARR